MTNPAAATSGKTFSELKVGDAAEFEVVLGEKEHAAFAELSGDNSPVHSDATFARAANFDGRIGYGFLLCGLLSRLYGEHLPGGSSICVTQESRFIRPYYPGDTIRVVGLVKAKLASTKMVEITTEMLRNGKETIFKGTGMVQVVSEEEPALYEAGGVSIGSQDFVKTLSAMGLGDGDVVFVHSDVSVFGRLRAATRSTLMESMCGALRTSVGESGTIIMPTFTYSFCEGEVFDPVQSKSTVGSLTEHFRRQPGVARSLHPIFSVAVSGNAREWFADVGPDSFDDDSIFGKLEERNGKLLFLGAPFQSCTFLHRVEQAYPVPYRYIKEFSGVIRDGDEDRRSTCTYLVRPLDRSVHFDVSRLEKRLIERGVMREGKLGEGRLLLVESRALFEEARELLGEDIHGLLAGAPE